jgi:hypothetical protein
MVNYEDFQSTFHQVFHKAFEVEPLKCKYSVRIKSHTSHNVLYMCLEVTYVFE